jgi:hypothetical protein
VNGIPTAPALPGQGPAAAAAATAAAAPGGIKKVATGIAGLTKMPAVKAMRDRLLGFRSGSKSLTAAAPGSSSSSSSSSSSTAGQAEVMAQLAARSSHVKAIQHDFATRKSEIASWAKRIRTAKFNNMSECAKLVEDIWSVRLALKLIFREKFTKKFQSAPKLHCM